MFGFGKKQKEPEQSRPEPSPGSKLQNPYRRFYGKDRSFEELVRGQQKPEKEDSSG